VAGDVDRGTPLKDAGRVVKDVIISPPSGGTEDVGDEEANCSGEECKPGEESGATIDDVVEETELIELDRGGEASGEDDISMRDSCACCESDETDPFRFSNPTIGKG